MKPDEIEIMYRVEDHHWWYQGMASITRSVITHWRLASDGMRILDAGCGTGGSAAGFLADLGQVTGVDISPISLHFCHMRKLERLALATVRWLPFCTGAFDLVTCFDVLSDQGVSEVPAVLQELKRVLKPGGWLLMRLPALERLHGHHDIAVQTIRRYTSSQIKTLFGGCGFTAWKTAYANSWLLPLILLKRWSEPIFRRSDTLSDTALDPGFANNLLRFILSTEAPLASRSLFPLGVSLFAAAQKGRGPSIS